MRYLFLLLVSPVFYFASAQAAEDDYPTTNGMWIMPDQHQHWYQACMAVKEITMPAEDAPTAKEGDAAADCVAIELYDDTKNASSSKSGNWKKVKACAVASNDYAVLMMLYANGLGVKRNLPLAVNYACRTAGASAEVTGRVDYLSTLSNGSKLTDFDICDHAGSGFMGGFCASREERLHTKVRSQRLSAIKQRFSVADLIAFQKLDEASTVFAKNRGEMETDLSGTLRAAFSIHATSSQLDAFVDLLDVLERDQGKGLRQYDATQEDRELNRQFQKVMTTKSEDNSEELGYSTIKKSDVRKAQRNWIAYRGAWIRFAQVRYSSLDTTVLNAYLTQLRVLQLRQLPD